MLHTRRSQVRNPPRPSPRRPATAGCSAFSSGVAVGPADGHGNSGVAKGCGGYPLGRPSWRLGLVDVATTRLQAPERRPGPDSWWTAAAAALVAVEGLAACRLDSPVDLAGPVCLGASPFTPSPETAGLGSLLLVRG
jgi:hypothetical protein